MTDPDRDTFQWLLLLGAILADKDLRASALAGIATEDVPKPLTVIWRAIKAGSGTALYQELERFHVRRQEGGKATTDVLAAVQHGILEDFCRASAASLSYAKGVTPAELLTMLEVQATKIRAKQAALEKSSLPKPEGTV